MSAIIGSSHQRPNRALAARGCERASGSVECLDRALLAVVLLMLPPFFGFAVTKMGFDATPPALTKTETLLTLGAG